MQIKITPEQVRQVSQQFKSTSEESQQQIQRLNAVIEGMRPDWEGMTAQRFYGDYSEWMTTMRTYVDVLNGIGLQLDQIAARFQQADTAG